MEIAELEVLSLEPLINLGLARFRINQDVVAHSFAGVKFEFGVFVASCGLTGDDFKDEFRHASQTFAFRGITNHQNVWAHDRVFGKFHVGFEQGETMRAGFEDAVEFSVDRRRHRLVRCGAIRAALAAAFPDRLGVIYRGLLDEIDRCRPDCVAVESLFYSSNVRSALKLGHARGVAMLAAVESGVPVLEYTPAEIKRAVVGYGRAEKAQVQQMVKLLLGLERAPSPHDVADALAVAICHAQTHSASAYVRFTIERVGRSMERLGLREVGRVLAGHGTRGGPYV